MTPEPLSQSDLSRVATLRAKIAAAVPASATETIKQRARAAAHSRLSARDKKLLTLANEVEATKQAVADLAHSGRGAAIRAEIAESIYRAELQGSLAATSAIGEPAPRAAPPAPQALAARPVAIATTVTAEARGFAAATARVVAVIESYHFEGRAEQAIKLLGNLKLSANEIIAMLGDMPDGSGAKMLAAIRASNPSLGTGGLSQQAEPCAANNYNWAAIQARARAELAAQEINKERK